MCYLIDGYNLLHAMGLLYGAQPAALESARRRLLRILRQAHRDAPGNVTVVFDASRPPPGVPAETDHQGIHVRFAVDQHQADDLIELLIRRATAPRTLTVVSDDHRVQRAARRRQCVVMGCGDYLDELARREQRAAQPRGPDRTPAKPERLSEAERQHWLEAFADLADSPELKEMSDPQESLPDDGEWAT